MYFCNLFSFFFVAGIIDIPIAVGKVDGAERMVLRPDVDGFRGRPGQSKKAMTKYRVNFIFYIKLKI